MNRLVCIVLPFALAAGAAAAQDHGTQDHGTHDHGAHGGRGGHADDAPAPAADPHAAHMRAPPPAEGPEHAADLYFDPVAMAQARAQLRLETGAMRTGAVVFDRLEAAWSDGEDALAWDVQAWTGGDIHRLWFKSEGEGEVGGRLEGADLQLLYGRAVTPFWDVQAGLRYDVRPDGGDLAYLALGVQGLAPHWWEVDAALFLSQDGDLTARAEAEYDQRITQRLILQPRLEVAAAAQDVPERRLGPGLTSVSAGLRLRYEIRREFAPYVGVEWRRALGEGAGLARDAGEEVEATALVAGLRAWF